MEEEDSRFTSPSFFVLFALGLAMFVPVNGEIRCYCNLPVCLSTSYMCKSSANVCFSELSSHAVDFLRSRRGCYELLHRPKKELCKMRLGNAKLTSGKFPLLLCCREDMCNHADSLDLRIQIKSNVTTYVSGVADQNGNMYLPGSNTHDSVINNDIWFKAAVIAIPITGCFILVMLVLLAVNMLKKDCKKHRELLAFRQERQMKAQTLLEDHLKSDYELQRNLVDGANGCEDNKNQTNAQFNEKQNNLYKNVNLVQTTKHSCNEKQYIYDQIFHNANDTFCGSVIAWSKSNWQSNSVHV